MKYPDINIQIKYPNKLINADTPIKERLTRYSSISRSFAYYITKCSLDILDTVFHVLTRCLYQSRNKIRNALKFGIEGL